jgi:RimJ/RimL family protein N-acetyltransferase
MLTVRLAREDDIFALYEHLRRHWNESGQDGDLIFNPDDGPWSYPYDQFESAMHEAWAKPPSECGWERSWILTDGTDVFGEIKLKHDLPMKFTLHRALLSMGLERPYRGAGHGTRLMTAALEWARAQESLVWLQLGVFAHNAPARALYRKFGFTEIGTTPDLFRTHGQSIDDIEMVLRLR